MKLFLPVIGRHAVMAAEPNGLLRIWCPPEAPVFAAGKGQVRIESDRRLTLRLLEPAVVVTYEGVEALAGLADGTLVGPGAVLGRAVPGLSRGILVQVEVPGRLNLTAYSVFQGGRDPVAAPLVEREEPVGRGSTRTTSSGTGDSTPAVTDIDLPEPVPLGGPSSSSGPLSPMEGEVSSPAQVADPELEQYGSSPTDPAADRSGGPSPLAPAEPRRPTAPVPQPTTNVMPAAPASTPGSSKAQPPPPTTPDGQSIDATEPTRSASPTSPPPVDDAEEAEGADGTAHRLAARSPRPQRRRRRKE